jgi:ADP-ribosylglycohydrolase
VTDPDARRKRALASLDGLSVGDAFGERLFFDPRTIERRETQRGPWRWTDDTEMAVAIVEVLERHGKLDQDALASAFAARYRADPYRGYGPGTHAVLNRIASGVPWRDASSTAFGGKGSMGNGSAMRVAPLGAYYADDLSLAVEEARRSAVVTHAHLDAQAGAIAVAVAAAWAASNAPDAPVEALFETVLARTPAGLTRDGIARASRLPLGSELLDAMLSLGSGSRILCSDTVPLCLWLVARHRGDYAEALWATVSIPGDRDTNCAIVGGVMAAATGGDEIPGEWLSAREPLRHAYE